MLGAELSSSCGTAEIFALLRDDARLGRDELCSTPQSSPSWRLARAALLRSIASCLFLAQVLAWRELLRGVQRGPFADLSGVALIRSGAAFMLACEGRGLEPKQPTVAWIAVRNRMDKRSSYTAADAALGRRL